ncbi:MAG: hypothetical protein EXR71_19135 [Myxococcales bacterium]|nr:hypothetical protein [Myxococcales bacterium]
MIWLAGGLGACGEAAELAAGGRQLADYIGVAGTRIEFAPAGSADETPLQLLIGVDRWTLRSGARWDEAEPVAEWAVITEPALMVDGQELLSMPLPDAVAVTTWYGEFAESVEASPDAGRVAGAWVFARGIGPIVVTVDSVSRECVFYEYRTGEAADTAAE